MDDGIGLELGVELVDQFSVGNASLNEGQSGVRLRKMNPATGGEVVDGKDLVSALEQHFRRAGTDLPTSS